ASADRRLLVSAPHVRQSPRASARPAVVARPPGCNTPACAKSERPRSDAVPGIAISTVATPALLASAKAATWTPASSNVQPLPIGALPGAAAKPNRQALPWPASRTSIIVCALPRHGTDDDMRGCVVAGQPAPYEAEVAGVPAARREANPWNDPPSGDVNT